MSKKLSITKWRLPNEEIFRIFQHSKTTGKPDITQWDTLMKLRNEYLSKKVVPLMLFDFNLHEFSDSFWNGQGYTVNGDSQYLVKSGPWKITDFQKSNIFYFIPLVRFISRPYCITSYFILTNNQYKTYRFTFFRAKKYYIACNWKLAPYRWCVWWK